MFVINFYFSKMNKSPQPIRFCREAMRLHPKKFAARLIGLSEVLLAQGQEEEAFRVARAALRGFVTFADDHKRADYALHAFLTAIEVLTADLATKSQNMRNALIRLYGRLLHLKHAAIHDWDHVEHAILRSAVVHGLSGDPASALADLVRKSKLWRINPDESYVVTTGFDKSQPISSLTGNDERSSGDDEESDYSDSYQAETKCEGKKQLRRRGVTEKLIAQRQSPTIAEWIESLNSHN